VISCLVTATVCAAQTDPDVLHWKLDEGVGVIASDATGQGRDGVIASTNTWTNGVSGSALHFDGAGDQVLEAYADEYLNGLGAITVAMWIKPDATGADRGLLRAADPPVGPSGVDGPLTLQYASAGPVVGGADVLTVAIDTSGGRIFAESSSNSQTTGWQHVAFIWSTGEPIRLYINGQPDATAWNGLLPPFPNSTHPDQFSQSSIVNIEKLVLGQGPGTVGWLGCIDDFRIYGRVLSEAEVAALALGDADLAVGLTIDNSSPEQGTSVVYQAVVENLGPRTAEGVVVTEIFSTNQLTFIQAAASTGLYTAVSGIWQIGRLAPGETETLDLVFTVVAEFPCEISNSVSVVAQNCDPVLENNSFTLLSPGQDQLEPDDSPGDATFHEFDLPGTNLVYNLNLHGPNDVDWFEVAWMDWMQAGLEVSVIPQSTNLDVQIEVYFADTNGTLVLRHVEDTGDLGVKEEKDVFDIPPGPAFPLTLYWRILPTPSTIWVDECPLPYSITLEYQSLASGVHLFGVNWLETPPGETIVPPPGLNTAHGVFGPAGTLFVPGPNDVWDLITVDAAPGYLPAESSNFPNQVQNRFNPGFGNPRWVVYSLSRPQYLFVFVPTVTVEGEVRDAVTLLPIEGAGLSFQATSRRIAGKRFDGYPEGARYESDWLTDSSGDFPSDVKLPTVNYTLTVSKAGYQTRVIPNAVLSPIPGGLVTLAASPIELSPVQVLTILPAGDVDFGTVAIGSNIERNLLVSNTGGGTLDGYATVVDLGVPSPFSVVSGAAYNLGANQTQEVMICYNPNDPATDVWNISFTGQSGTEWRAVRGIALSNADSDGDGVGDWPEFIAGTSWTDSNDFLRLKSERTVPGTTDYETCWDSVTGRIYTLEGAFTPDGPWTQVYQSVGSATQQCHSTPTSAGDDRQFRLNVHLAE
jgi:hypothetical protein